ncbi:TetR family transcriptional regulator [Streptomyces gardneri]|uniref:TetR family transcriptional regulator n=1 Tax=Nocardia TaxID=1817 RepID=UPI001359DEB6|nr:MULTISPECIES: TetR family transcriptional regulator [Nocardia]MBF6168269.1 TetR family transcriptional regulator [Streptomyces gardneri]MBF6204651.1 TetR family transcriptional regulator [Streptomyces gardneri]
MSVELPAKGTVQGLRERKKERTRRSIRVEAFRLFREQGYNETTIEQIAAAAEVSPSTFFRYFPTKEQLVLADDLDPMMLEALRRQPRDVSPLTAFRGAVVEVFSSLPAAELAFEQERQALLYHVPELRSAIGLEIVRSIDLLANLLADHVGRSADDFEIRVAAGAVAGAALAISTMTPMNVENITRALDLLEAGLPLRLDHKS